MDATAGLEIAGDDGEVEFDEAELQRELRSATLERNGIAAEIRSLQAMNAPHAMRKRIDEKLAQLRERKQKADERCDSLDARLAGLQSRGT